MDEQAEMIERAVFGKQVAAFMNTEIGKYMLLRAAEEKRTAQSDFLEVDPCNTSEVIAIQNRIKVANSIASWLADAVSDGLSALNIIEDRS